MATQMLSLSEPYDNRSAVLCILARRAAIKAIKQQLQAQGVRLSYISPRDIRAFANAYFAEHREALIEHAMETVRLVPQLRTLYEREQRELRGKH
jgi:hypothetical protein